MRRRLIRRRRVEQCQGAEEADAAQSMGKLEQEIAGKVEESRRTRGEVLALIGQIQDPSENAVLVLHYINGDSLERVGEKMDRSERWARDKHTQALDRLCGL